MKRWFVLILTLIIISILVVTGFYGSFRASGFFIKELPNNADNVFIFTVDDIALKNEKDREAMKKIIAYLESKNIPATLFAVPSEMRSYIFSSNFEIAQHGYNHVNPKDGSFNEFKGLCVDEVEYRLRKGKTLLEDMGYDIYGQRAPGWSLDKEQLCAVEDLYVYDSSSKDSLGNECIQVIPVLWLDFLFEACKQKPCDENILEVDKKRLFSIIDEYDRIKRPLVILSHISSLHNAIEDDVGKRHIDSFFEEINRRNYWKTTMINFVKWNNLIN